MTDECEDVRMDELCMVGKGGGKTCRYVPYIRAYININITHYMDIGHISDEQI